MATTVKLPVDVADNLVSYVSVLQEKLSPELFIPTREQAEAMAYFLVELSDAR
jgi:hypothetical protein